MLIKCAVNLDNLKLKAGDFPGGPVVKNPPANTGDTGSIFDLGRFHKPQRS